MNNIFVIDIQEAEQAQKYKGGKAGQQQAGKQAAGGSNQQRLATLEAEKQKIEKEIADLKQQKR